MAAQKASCIVWLVALLVHSVPTAVSLQVGTSVNATEDLMMSPSDQTSSWSCTSIGASSFSAQYNSYISGSTIVVTNNAMSQLGRAYYTWANTGGFKISFDMYQGGGSGADGMCMKYGGYDYGEQGENIAANGFSVCFDSYPNDNDHGVEMGWNGGIIFSEIGTGYWSHNVPLFEDSTWHNVVVEVTPSGSGANVILNYDKGSYYKTA
ncbi:unnamed protein product, partial [Prorocentrum cordatum]